MDNDKTFLEEMAGRVVDGIGVVDITNSDFSPIIDRNNTNTDEELAAEQLLHLENGGFVDINKKLEFEDVNNTKAVISIPFDYITLTRNKKNHIIRQLPEGASMEAIDKEVEKRDRFFKNLKSVAITTIQRIITNAAHQQNMMVGSKRVQSIDDVKKAWKNWQPDDLETLKAMFYSVEGQFLKNPTWDEVLEKDFMETDDKNVRYEYCSEPDRTEQHKKPGKCVASVFRSARSEVKKSITRAGETTHGFTFNLTVPVHRQPHKNWRRKAGDHSFHPLFLKNPSESVLDAWMEKCGKKIYDEKSKENKTWMRKEERCENKAKCKSPTGVENNRQIGYSKGTARSSIRTGDISDTTNKGTKVNKEIQALKIKLKKAEAKAKKKKKEDEQRMRILLKENEKMHNLNKTVECEKNKKHIKEAHKRNIPRNKKRKSAGKGKGSNAIRKKGRTMQGKDDNGKYRSQMCDTIKNMLLTTSFYCLTNFLESDETVSVESVDSPGK